MKYIIIYLLIFGLFSCNKQDFLNKRPNQNHLVPITLAELQAVLDADADMNGMGSAGRGGVPGLGETGADNYYLTDADYNGRLLTQIQNYYRWAKEVYEGYQVYNWDYPYVVVFNANIVIDGLSRIERTFKNAHEYDLILGRALFYRSHAFYQLVQVFAPPYQSHSSHTDWGIPLRLSSDLGEKIERATIQETYDRIIADLLEAKFLLTKEATIVSRPNKQAAYGLLARVFQTMQDYDQALLYADSCLQIQNELLDYNTLNPNDKFPFVGGSNQNKEVIFASNMISRPNLTYPFKPSFALVDTNLYNSYHNADLRKRIFFQTKGNGASFKGSYDGQEICFAGIAVDEIYLIRAECFARKGKLKEAMNDINKLMKNRWDINYPFIPFDASNADEAIELILEERRKELVFRGLRWTDLRRLNLEGRNIALSRKINGVIYTLPPNDLRYTYPIPNEVIAFNKDMPQNIR